MATCVVYDKATDKPINIIVADPLDTPPEGCYLVEMPSNAYWDGENIITQEPN